MDPSDFEEADRRIEIDANGHKVEIPVWSTPVRGLVAHPTVVEVDVEGSGEVIYSSSGWVLTHVDTGAAVVQRQDSVKSLDEARSVAVELARFDPNTWDMQNPSVKVSYAKVKEAIDVVVERRRMRVMSYAVRPTVHGYAIIRLKDDEEVEVHPHRGIAGRRRRELEEGQG